MLAQVAELVAPLRAKDGFTYFVKGVSTFARSWFVPTSDPKLVERVVAAVSAAPPHIAIGAFEALLGHGLDLQAGFQEIKASMIAINSCQTNLEAAQRYGIAVMQMSGVGHFVMLEDPQTFNRLLDEAVQRCLNARMP